MIGRVRPRGFVTETELLYLLPKLEDYVYDYELILEELQRNSIKVVETGEGYLETGAEKVKKEEILFLRGEFLNFLVIIIIEVSFLTVMNDSLYF